MMLCLNWTLAGGRVHQSKAPNNSTCSACWCCGEKHPLSMLYALERKLEVDGFVVYTDSETRAGKIHPVQALAEYRRKTGIAAKLVVVGFDTAAPAAIADFLRQ